MRPAERPHQNRTKHWEICSSSEIATLTVEEHTPLEDWRDTFFGTILNEGDAADDADPDSDGSTNREEFDAGTDPIDENSRPALTDTDSDRDGYTDSEEAIFGTDPNAASPKPEVDVHLSGQSNSLIISIQSIANRRYALEGSLDGTRFVAVDGQEITGDGGIIEFINSLIPRSNRFYRIRVAVIDQSIPHYFIKRPERQTPPQSNAGSQAPHLRYRDVGKFVSISCAIPVSSLESLKTKSRYK